jgi:hypothetical protein
VEFEAPSNQCLAPIVQAAMFFNIEKLILIILVARCTRLLSGTRQFSLAVWGNSERAGLDVASVTRIVSKCNGCPAFRHLI